MKKVTFFVLATLLVFASYPTNVEGARQRGKVTNKLLYMYRFFYLPFSIEFREGIDKNEVLPYVLDGNRKTRLIKAEELSALDKDWSAIRQSWIKRSLFLNTPVPIGKTARISRHLRSHVIDLKRGALDNTPIQDRIKLKHAMKNKPRKVWNALVQLRFLKSFLSPEDEGKFNFFIVGASWCNSTREYRSLLESYLKKFANPKVNLHSLLIQDPQEKVFQSKLINELFPNSKDYSHESIPRFLAIENVKGKAQVYEEGEALQQLYNRFLGKQRGFLNHNVSLFNKNKTRNLSSPKK